MSSYRGMSSQSPYSSSDHGYSVEGTPNTSLTTFSPEEVKPSRPSNTRSITSGTSIAAGQNDPFVTTAQPNARSLSATASSFRPLALGLEAKSGSLQQQSPVSSPARVSEHEGGSRLSSVGGNSSSPTHFGTFSTDTGARRNLKISAIYDSEVQTLVDASLENLKDRGFKFSGGSLQQSKGNVVYFKFNNIDDASEVYTIVKMDNPTTLAVEYMSLSELSQIVSPGKVRSAHEGQVILTALYPAVATLDKKVFEDGLRQLLEVDGKLCAWQKISATEAGTCRLIAEFCDIKKAREAILRCNGTHSNGVLIMVQAHEPDLVSRRLTPPLGTPTRHSGETSSLDEAMTRLVMNGPPPHFAADGDVLRSTVPNPSGLHYMHRNGQFSLPPTPPMTVGAMGSFYASNPVNPIQLGYLPSLYPHLNTSGNAAAHGFNGNPRGHAGYDHHALGHAGPLQSRYGNEIGYYGPGCSPARRSPPYDRPSGRRQNAVTVMKHYRGRSSNAVSAHHNHVDTNRIQQGTDVRTTVMLRNIPNKLDQPQLKSIIDESSFGKYDFMYLRIDFSNNCNVGYAFINFNDPLDIIDFVRARSGEKWYKSDKVAEVSYATIQGKDCLVQKFRNSSVMLEPPHCRPKLYRIYDDAYGCIGDEERFPDSDNASKLKRSCENAEHVGLFAPSAGQHMRDEQRRRRSQYDRGTSLAEREEIGYGGYEGYEGHDEDYSVYSLFRYPSY